ncbi:unnamed protein product [Symbiodinium sp. CCMP2592]|nr:unnamed protein product [Symbiodinium sp. CCMP2592]
MQQARSLSRSSRDRDQASKLSVRYRWQTPPECTSEKLGCKLIDMSVRVNLDKFMAINQTSQTFKAQFFFQAETKVPKGDAEKVKKFLENIQKSDCAGADRIVVENMVDPLEGPPFKPWLSEREEDGKITFTLSWRIVGEFGESLELHDFPFDCQDFTVTLCFFRACKRDELQVRFIDAEASRVPLRVFSLENTWNRPHRLIIGPSFSDPRDNCKGAVFPLLHVTVQMQRVPKYYFLNIVVPMCSIVAMSACYTQIKATEIADRLSTSLTLVLTAVAYKYLVAQMVPAIGYSTWLDWYVLMCWFFLAGIVLENCLALKNFHRTEFIWQVVLYSSFAMGNIWFAKRAWDVYRAQRTKLSPHGREHEEGLDDFIIDGSDDDDGTFSFASQASEASCAFLRP